MKNRLTLGKILIILLLPIYIFAADVKAFVDRNIVTKGDNITYTISATGSNIEFPNVSNIDGIEVNGVSTSTNIAIINGNYNKTLKRHYSMQVEKNTTIPSFSVKIDGKEYKTQPIGIKVVKSSATSNIGGAKIELIASKTKAYVGEPIELNVKITLPRDTVQYNVEEIENKDFWIKQIGNPTERVFRRGSVINYKFLLTPQKAGKLKLNPIILRVAKKDKRTHQSPFGDDDFFDFVFTNPLKEFKIRSNSLTFNVEPLPQNLEVAGKFDFSVRVDKTKVQAGKPVNLTIKIRGTGNLEDIKKFNLDLADAVVYADEPKVQTYIQNGAEVGEFVQKIAVVAENNITIPPIEFKYFDLDAKKVVTKKSQPIEITVIGGTKKSANTPPKIESATPTVMQTPKTKESIKTLYKEQNSWLKYLFLLIGLIAGAAVVIGYNRLKSKNKNKAPKPIVKQIKKAKNDKELFKTLLPFAKESKIIEESLQKLEQNIYKGAKNKIDKNKIIEYFEDEVEG